mmetsp:Transcript_21337/g.36679  ORF Transcript_21337/g.36679 Transcript_21337/m.36679 type:complete len:123 (-) Transcript_21337:459-827(-)
MAPISFVTASLGGKVKVKGLYDKKNDIEVDIPTGTQPDAVLTVPDQGMPLLNARRSSSRGNMMVHVRVVIPTKLSEKARQLLQELDKQEVISSSSEISERKKTTLWKQFKEFIETHFANKSN